MCWFILHLVYYVVKMSVMLHGTSLFWVLWSVCLWPVELSCRWWFCFNIVASSVELHFFFHYNFNHVILKSKEVENGYPIVGFHWLFLTSIHGMLFMWRFHSNIHSSPLLKQPISTSPPLLIILSLSEHNVSVFVALSSHQCTKEGRKLYFSSSCNIDFNQSCG